MSVHDDVVACKGPKICVIAAPGSGKTTRILIPKAKQILADAGIDPKNVLLLTFSRLSAKDLKEKVTALGDRAPRASTVHSLCLSFLLSENEHGMRKRVESIVLSFEKEALICDLKQTLGGNKRDLRKLLDEFSAGWAIRPHDTIFEEDDRKRSLKHAVVNWLSEHEAAMMEEIVYGAVELAKALGAAEFIQAPQYILVDEFQDLNELEQEFIRLLAADSQLLLVVGDPNQSIYSFKFAHPAGIEDLSRARDVTPFNSLETGRCPQKIVELANQLLVQARPERGDLLKSIREDDGEVHLVRKDTQAEEFDYVIRSIAGRLAAGANPSKILVLAPKTALGAAFVDRANQIKQAAGVPEAVGFTFESQLRLSPLQQERLLLLGLIVKPDSLLHTRGYLALNDDNAFASELKLLKDKYGGLRNAIEKADREDFDKRKTRVRALSDRIKQLREFLGAARDVEDVDGILEEVFPSNIEELDVLRDKLAELREDDDSIESLYSKLIDELRNPPVAKSDVRVMTLRGSKGLEAEHVYILGCNAGNLPGEYKPEHLSSHEHKEEQRRLLFVGVTRATKSITISWARYIPFGQSRQHYTGGVRTVRHNGQVMEVMAICEFLQDLPRQFAWES